MKKPVLAVFVLAALIASTGLIASAQTVLTTEKKPSVVKAVAPTQYPFRGIPSLKAQGKVVVRVKISATGEVTYATVISGHELLRAPSIAAARKWLFAPGGKNDADRVVDLEFIYTPVSREEEVGVFFIPPYQVEIATTVGRISLRHRQIKILTSKLDNVTQQDSRLIHLQRSAH